MTQDEVRVVARETVLATLDALGIDTANPMDTQADFNWLHTTRKNSEKFRYGVFLAGCVGLVGFLGAVLWAGIEQVMTKSGQ